MALFHSLEIPSLANAINVRKRTLVSFITVEHEINIIFC